MWLRRTKVSPNSYRVPVRSRWQAMCMCICVSVFVLFVCSTKSEQNHSRTIQDGLKLCSLHASLPQANSSVSLHQGEPHLAGATPLLNTTVSLQPMPTYWYYVIAGGWRHFPPGLRHVGHGAVLPSLPPGGQEEPALGVLPEHVHGTVHRRRPRGSLRTWGGADANN